jgi:hypothetical protein
MFCAAVEHHRVSLVAAGVLCSIPGLSQKRRPATPSPPSGGGRWRESTLAILLLLLLAKRICSPRRHCCTSTYENQHSEMHQNHALSSDETFGRLRRLLTCIFGSSAATITIFLGNGPYLVPTSWKKTYVNYSS